MKNSLEMNVFSRQTITESLARAQITALSEFEKGLMRPDKCNRVEPIKFAFDPNDISEPIRWLNKPHGTFFYKKGRPTYLAGEIWNQTHPPTARFPSPLFCSRWTGRFDQKWVARIGVEKVETFVSETFRLTRSDFGALSTGVDFACKNTNAVRLSFQGMDLALGIPGLYWINFFSDELGKWLGLETLPREVGSITRIAGGGWLLKFCEAPEQCRDLDLLQRQRATIEWLGAERFFDIRSMERKLEAPNWDHMDIPLAK